MHKMRGYHLLSMRVNLTKEEVSELSAEMTKRMFQEVHLDEILQKDTVNKSKDLFFSTQIFKEIKFAFPFIDTVTNGWLMLPNIKNSVDTFPIVFYQTLRPINKTQTNQLYNFLCARLAKDTIVLMKK